MKQRNSTKSSMVAGPRFELGITESQTQGHTKLDHPANLHYLPFTYIIKLFDFVKYQINQTSLYFLSLV